MGTQTPAVLLSMAELRRKSKKGPVWVPMLARLENREAQLAAPPLTLLSIPGHLFCWPGQIRWILGPTPVPRLKPHLPGRALGLAALLGLLVPHSTGTAPGTWGCAASGGDDSAQAIPGQGAGVAAGILGALLQAGMNTVTQEGKQPQLVCGMGTEPFSTGGKVKAKSHLEMDIVF